MLQPLWEGVWPFLSGLNRELPAGPAIPLLGVCPKEVKMGF